MAVAAMATAFALMVAARAYASMDARWIRIAARAIAAWAMTLSRTASTVRRAAQRTPTARLLAMSATRLPGLARLPSIRLSLGSHAPCRLRHARAASACAKRRADFRAHTALTSAALPASRTKADGCPGSGVCTTNRTGSSTYCLEPCATSADCRAEYTCAPSDPANAESPKGCVPGCDADADCQNASRRGWVCNNGTGLCQPPLDTDTFGGPCTATDDCVGGLCETESFDGYPSGMCVASGCRLSSEGGSEPCPGASVCVPGNLRDPSLGVCVPSCSASAPLPCRSGYACEALVEGETAGACRPACGETSCSAGRTCNSESGLCTSAT
jgi:hypothetical protein